MFTSISNCLHLKIEGDLEYYAKRTISWCIPVYTCGSLSYSTHIQSTEQRQFAYIGEEIYYANVIRLIMCIN